jgi:hypothetical protein
VLSFFEVKNSNNDIVCVSINPLASIIASDTLVHEVAHLSWRVGDLDAGISERLDLGISTARLARDDGSGMAHTTARWRCHARNERNHWLRLRSRVSLLQELGGLLLGRTSDLTDQDDALGLRVLEENVQAVLFRVEK